MLTSVWRDILDYSIPGNKLGGGAMSPLHPLEKIYTQQLFLGTNAQSYPVIHSTSNSGADFGTSWYYGYGPTNYCGYQFIAMESPTPSDVASFFRITKRSDDAIMFEATFDKPTRSGQLSLWENSGLTKTIYFNSNSTSYFLRAIVFGATSLDYSHGLGYDFQVVPNALFKGSILGLSTLATVGDIRSAGDFWAGTAPTSPAKAVNEYVRILWLWYIAIHGDDILTSLSDNEATQITSINEYHLSWNYLSVINQGLSTGDSPAFNNLRSNSLQGLLSEGVISRNDFVPLSTDSLNLGKLDSLRWNIAFVKYVRATEYQNMDGDVVLGEWHQVPLDDDGDIADGIGITYGGSSPIASINLSYINVRWCWLGSNTITLQGYLYFNRISGVINQLILIPKGNFSWAKVKIGTVNPYGHASIHNLVGSNYEPAYINLYGSNDLTLLSLTPSTSSFNQYANFSVIYEVVGPIAIA
jgi:hypothetical protein